MAVPPARSRTLAALLVLLLAALGLRVATVLRHGERPLEGDEGTYSVIAANLVAGHGYAAGWTPAERHPTATRGPAYVFYLAAVYRLAGVRIVPPLLGQCGMEVLSALLLYWISRRVFADEEIALVAAGLYAFYPPFIVDTGELITEALTNLLVLAAFAAFVAFLTRGRMRSLAWMGLALGVCALSKPQVAPVAPLLPLAAWPTLGARRSLAGAALASTVTGLCLAPWVIRNALVLHAFVPGITTGGISFWGGTAPFGGRFTGGLGAGWIPAAFRRRIQAMDEVHQNRWFLADGVRIILADPRRYAKLCARKFAQLWLNLGYDDPPSGSSWFLAAANLGAFLAAGWGALRARPAAGVVLALGALWAYWTAVNVAVCTVVRYAMPFYAILLAFTAAGLVSAARRAAPAGAAA